MNTASAHGWALRAWWWAMFVGVLVARADDAALGLRLPVGTGGVVHEAPSPVATPGTAAADEPGYAKVSALFIGVSKYAYQPPGGGSMDLRFAHKDAADLAAAFRERCDLAYSAVLQDDKATLDGVTTALRDLAPKVGPDDLFIFHFSGHGVLIEVNGVSQGFLLLHDYAPPAGGFPTQGVLTMDTLTRYLNRCNLRPRHVLFILDCCHSGAAIGYKAVSLRGLPPADAREAFRAEIEREACTVLTAGERAQVALDGRAGTQENGMLSFWLLKTLETPLADLPGIAIGARKYVKLQGVHDAVRAQVYTNARGIMREAYASWQGQRATAAKDRSGGWLEQRFTEVAQRGPAGDKELNKLAQYPLLDRLGTTGEVFLPFRLTPVAPPPAPATPATVEPLPPLPAAPPPPPQDDQVFLSFALPQQEVKENCGILEIKVVRAPVTATAATIAFRLEGTPLDGRECKLLTPSPLTVPAGQEAAAIRVQVVDQAAPDTYGRFRLLLLPAAGQRFGSYGFHTTTIRDKTFVPKPPLLPAPAATPVITGPEGTPPTPIVAGPPPNPNADRLAEWEKWAKSAGAMYRDEAYGEALVAALRLLLLEAPPPPAADAASLAVRCDLFHRPRLADASILQLFPRDAVLAKYPGDDTPAKLSFRRLWLAEQWRREHAGAGWTPLRFVGDKVSPHYEYRFYLDNAGTAPVYYYLVALDAAGICQWLAPANAGSKPEVYSFGESPLAPKSGLALPRDATQPGMTVTYGWPVETVADQQFLLIVSATRWEKLETALAAASRRGLELLEANSARLRPLGVALPTALTRAVGMVRLDVSEDRPAAVAAGTPTMITRNQNGLMLLSWHLQVVPPDQLRPTLASP